jgi:hypothetical protein
VLLLFIRALFCLGLWIQCVEAGVFQKDFLKNKARAAAATDNNAVDNQRYLLGIGKGDITG